MNARVGSFVLALVATAALAQEKPAAASLPAGGDVFVVTIGAWDFSAAGSSQLYEPGALGASTPLLLRGAGPFSSTNMVSNVHLPTGVVIDHIELDACDLDATEGVDSQVTLLDCDDAGGGPGDCTDVGSARTTTNGCAYVASQPVGATVDNTNRDYILLLAVPNSNDVGVRGVKVYYHLQVSPAPATATFNDVPTSDPAFQFIEAFAKAGVTAGCSAIPPLYCPDATVTRRQMAVFFAKALGLRWPG